MIFVPPELYRAGFEPLMLPHVLSGSKPARIPAREKQTDERAEFFALPPFTFHLSLLQSCPQLLTRNGSRKSHPDLGVKPHRDTK